MNKPRFIYLIQAEGAGRYKIGHAAAPGQRLNTLQTASHCRLQLLVKIAVRDATAAEKHLHKKYRDSRTSGEWFEFAEVEPVIDYMTGDFAKTFGGTRATLSTARMDDPVASMASSLRAIERTLDRSIDSELSLASDHLYAIYELNKQMIGELSHISYCLERLVSAVCPSEDDDGDGDFFDYDYAVEEEGEEGGLAEVLAGDEDE